MEASNALSPHPQLPPSQFEPDVEKIKRNLLRKGVFPTPKIIRTLRKKEIQKHNRKLQKSKSETPSISPSQLQSLAEESHFHTLKREYKRFTKAIDGRTKSQSSSLLLVGKPWERTEKTKLLELASGDREFDGEGLKRENLGELREMFEKDLRWVLDDDVEVEGKDLLQRRDKQAWDPARRWGSEKEAIRVLVVRLSEREITQGHWKFVRIMKQSGLPFTEGQLLKIVEGLGKNGRWRQAMAVVEWVYGDKEHGGLKSRFVYTKLLSVLGKARRPQEALKIFNTMRGDCLTYPDMAAYHSLAVTLGQAGLLKELMHIVECMRKKPTKKIKNMSNKNWDPVLEPDLVVYNAVLNACVPLQQWKGVSWVFEQLRKTGLKPNGATYGLAMEVMLQSGKYDLVHELFRRMKRSGEAPKALTYRVLVKAFWEEGKIEEAVAAVRDMEQRGLVGKAGVYYELACCLCSTGRWHDALTEVDKIKKLTDRRPMEITFTGLIMACLDGGYFDDCISIFQHMKDHCSPNIGTINVMLKVYGQNDMFPNAKELFEEIKRAKSGASASPNGNFTSIIPDEYTYTSMLEASASAHQWEYFEYVYKEMVLSGYQLDQTKHGLLLVEASRAGKCHLLEHAFDSLLDSGEIPNSLFFTEILIEAIAQRNYEKALNLLNAMAYAPFQVSEKQWTDVLNKNGDKISQDGLRKLLNALCNSELSSEITASNLLSSLQAILGSATSRDPLNFNSLDGEATGKSCNNRRIHGNGSVKMLSATDMTGNVTLDPPKKATDVTSDLFPASYSGNVEENAADIEIVSWPLNSDMNDDVASSVEPIDCFVKKPFAKDMSGYSSDVDEAEIDLPLNDVGSSLTSKLPAAHEILEAWKESQNIKGIFFPIH
ncbi:hypothetical protein SLA2020_471200 [Shorea laevis]